MFDKIIDSSLDVVRIFCILFCGPFILVECILSLAYYNRITDGCPYMTDAITTILIYVIIVFGCISLIVTGFCCYMSCLLGKTIKDVFPQLRQGGN